MLYLRDHVLCIAVRNITFLTLFPFFETLAVHKSYISKRKGRAFHITPAES